MTQKKITGIVAFVALVVGIYVATIIAPPGVQTGSPDAEQQTFNTEYVQLFPQPRALTDFALIDHNNQPVDKSVFTGKWSLLFVGYTYCPDVCPTTMAAINSAYKDLVSATPAEPQVVFLSVDPKRDTIERLNEYMNFFNPAFIGMTGEHKELFPLVRSMGMMYAMTESTDTPDYLIDHSASIVVINPQAQVVGRFKPQHTPGQLAISDTDQIIADLPILMSQG
ncbi:SCO family protein [Alteromonas sp. ASW11-36]|uniref:SCO family protein n=1 Tax=Alteromonas arenosi TaxID=3055817 RepID=A0ABT7T0S9_9ALTE|nr:SCO family protein [Alteromonas sp. ASW11-36]MDM7862047.1 SCO family protein [Alteromonas sp. ASW11-36]